MRHLARLLSTVLLAVALVAGSAALLAAPANAKTWLAPAADPDKDPLRNLDEFENRVLNKINRVRARHDLERVRYFQSCVDAKSESWSRRIKQTGSFVHRDQTKVLRDCDLAWTGETLVRGVGLTPKVAVRAWLNSPSHRAVLLKPRARWAGVGVKVDGQGRTIGVLNFGDVS